MPKMGQKRGQNRRGWVEGRHGGLLSGRKVRRMRAKNIEDMRELWHGETYASSLERDELVSDHLCSHASSRPHEDFCLSEGNQSTELSLPGVVSYEPAMLLDVSDPTKVDDLAQEDVRKLSDPLVRGPACNQSHFQQMKSHASRCEYNLY